MTIQGRLLGGCNGRVPAQLHDGAARLRRESADGAAEEFVARRGETRIVAPPHADAEGRDSARFGTLSAPSAP